MSTVSQSPPSLFTCLLSVIFLVNSCSCFNPKLFNVSRLEASSSDWSSAGATWYGSPNGAGSDGGACGYGNTVGSAPFSSRISAGNGALFMSGKGCGTCYQVRCTGNSACSGNPVTVVITDECPSCGPETVHFDLSGTSFGAMAVSGQADKLRNTGVLPIQYKRVLCNYPDTRITFRVDLGSNPNYFASVIEYVNGDGALARVELKEGLSFLYKDNIRIWQDDRGKQRYSGRVAARQDLSVSSQFLMAMFIKCCLSDMILGKIVDDGVFLSCVKCYCKNYQNKLIKE